MNRASASIEGSLTDDEELSVEPLLRASGALLEGHFVLSSGLHSDRYIQCARLLSDPRYSERTGRAIAAASQRFTGPCGCDAVIGPALGGIVIAHEVARALRVRALFAEREAGVLALRRGFTIAPNERILVVEDVVTTGGSAAETARLVGSHGGQVVGFGAIVDRSEAGHGLAPLCALWRFRPQTFSPADCPLCAGGLPVVKPGSRPEREQSDLLSA